MTAPTDPLHRAVHGHFVRGGQGGQVTLRAQQCTDAGGRQRPVLAEHDQAIGEADLEFIPGLNLGLFAYGFGNDHLTLDGYFCRHAVSLALPRLESSRATPALPGGKAACDRGPVAAAKLLARDFVAGIVPARRFPAGTARSGSEQMTRTASAPRRSPRRGGRTGTSGWVGSSAVEQRPFNPNRPEIPIFIPSHPEFSGGVKPLSFSLFNHKRNAGVILLSSPENAEIDEPG